MKFFWRQPTYQSDLDHLFLQLAQDNAALSARKEASMEQLRENAPFPDDLDHARQSGLPSSANPCR